MKRILILFFTLSAYQLNAANIKPGCFQLKKNGVTLERCLPHNIDYDHIHKVIVEVVKNKVQDLRLIGIDGNKDLFFSASVSADVPNFCQMQYDRIIRYDAKMDKAYEVWSSEKNLKNIFDNIDHVRLLYLLNTKDNPDNLHKCSPVVHLIKSKKISKNKASNYNFLLREDNQLVIHSDGKPGIFIFSPKFEKILGSLLIPEEFYSIIDAEISPDGTLVTILRDEVNHLNCLSEYDVESTKTLFKTCAPKDRSFSFLHKEDDEIYVMFNQSLKAKLLKSLSSIKANIKEIKH